MQNAKLSKEVRSMKNAKVLRRVSRGLSVVELLVVLAVGAVIATGALTVYFFQIRPTMYVDGKIQAFNQLAVALEHIKGYYGNSYPTGHVPDIGALEAETQNELQRLLVARLGAKNSKFIGWSYRCDNDSGNKLRITVYVGDTGDTTLKQSVQTGISRSYSRDWDCTGLDANNNNNTFSCTLKHSLCR